MTGDRGNALVVTIHWKMVTGIDPSPKYSWPCSHSHLKPSKINIHPLYRLTKYLFFIGTFTEINWLMLINKIWVYVRIFSYSRRRSAGIGQSRGGVLPLRSVRDMKVMMGHRPFPLGSPNTHWSAMIFIKLRLLPYGWTRLDQPPLSSSPQLNWIVHLFPLCHLPLYPAIFLFCDDMHEYVGIILCWVDRRF